MPSEMCSHISEIDDEYGDRERLIDPWHHAAQQHRWTLLGNEIDDLVGADQAAVGAQFQQHAVSLADIQQLLPVEVLLGGGEGGDGRRVHDLVLVRRLPVAVGVDEICAAGLDPAFDLRHTESVCQLVRADKVAHLVLLVADVDPASGGARDHDHLETHQLLLEDVDVLDLVVTGLFASAPEHALEVETVV